MRTLLYSIKGEAATQVYHDSTYAIPIQAEKQLVSWIFGRGGEAGRSSRLMQREDRQAKQRGLSSQVRHRKHLSTGVSLFVTDCSVTSCGVCGFLAGKKNDLGKRSIPRPVYAMSAWMGKKSSG